MRDFNLEKKKELSIKVAECNILDIRNYNNYLSHKRCIPGPNLFAALFIATSFILNYIGFV